ncbi:phosphonoacetaldehyde reductase [Paraglaciecola sp.]|uniref:phosphonoacetaldehyde reductase n=1 Tax=Paraglaciecola sp. TaxID=1920173 RepID=UPI003EFA82B9
MAVCLSDYPHVNVIQSEDYLADTQSLLQDGKVLLVTSKGFSQKGIIDRFKQLLGDQRLVVFDSVKPNPDKAFLIASYADINKQNIKNVIALGGGSVLDSAKVFSAMLGYPNIFLDKLFQRKDLVCKTNLICIPTTAGTGAEVTPFATVWDTQLKIKHSLYGIKASSAILDPSLTLTLPYIQTLYPALDTLSHGLESLWNKASNEETEKWAKQAIEDVCEYLPLALSSPLDSIARAKLASASTCAGIAISETKTALAHALSYPLTLHYGVPHGLACSVSLIAIIERFGAAELNLTSHLADRVCELCKLLKINLMLEEYVDWQTLIQEFDTAIDPSRAGNFIHEVDARLVSDLLLRSQQIATGTTH